MDHVYDIESVLFIIYTQISYITNAALFRHVIKPLYAT